MGASARAIRRVARTRLLPVIERKGAAGRQARPHFLTHCASLAPPVEAEDPCSRLGQSRLLLATRSRGFCQCPLRVDCSLRSGSSGLQTTNAAPPPPPASSSSTHRGLWAYTPLGDRDQTGRRSVFLPCARRDCQGRRTQKWRENGRGSPSPVKREKDKVGATAQRSVRGRMTRPGSRSAGTLPPPSEIRGSAAANSIRRLHERTGAWWTATNDPPASSIPQHWRLPRPGLKGRDGAPEALGAPPRVGNDRGPVAVTTRASIEARGRGGGRKREGPRSGLGQGAAEDRVGRLGRTRTSGDVKRPALHPRTKMSEVKPSPRPGSSISLSTTFTPRAVSIPPRPHLYSRNSRRHFKYRYLSPLGFS